MLPAAKLRALLKAGDLDSALKLCEERVKVNVGGGYYRYWLRRLKSNKPLPAEAIRMNALSRFQNIGNQIHGPDFSGSRYVFSSAPPVLECYLVNEKEALVSKSPFKAEIYQPTAKIPLPNQVVGLRRVNDLLSKENLDTSSFRFQRLREWIQCRGHKRVFVIGNGPSLKRTDLALLENEITIGFNGIFLHSDFKPTIYMVEDHLVAEDRISEIHNFSCPVKIFPSYLAYCVEAQDNTIFLNHRPRISYPVDTDFTCDAGKISYTGGTVTYTGLQVAASLGVEEIILIGVDASYRVHNVDRDDKYGTGVLTSKEDDTNHFDPRYFGKGYRWHDPNVHTMLQAYRKAREFGRVNNIRIVNATIGGELEVFPRTNFYQLFAPTQSWPRLAVLDFTSVNRLSATGIVKRNLLEGYPKSSQLHVWSDERSRLIAFQNIPNDLYAEGSDDHTAWAAFRSLIEYNPEVLYVRPTHDRISMTVFQVVAAQVLGKPWVVHYMDDWLRKVYYVRDKETADAYQELMDWVFRGAAEVFAICEKMSRFLVEKFALDPVRVSAIHNMLPKANRSFRREGSPDNIVRYFGGLESDMVLSTIIEFARQIDRLNLLNPDGKRTYFELIVSKHAIEKNRDVFKDFEFTRLIPQFEDYQDYLEALSTSGANLICYNFDERTLGYVRYSLANKLPELIASGVPFLVIGHPEIGTLELLKDAEYPWILTDSNFSIDEAMAEIFNPTEATIEAWRASIKRLKEEFSEDNNRYKFHRLLRRASRTSVNFASLPIKPLQALIHVAQKEKIQVKDLDLMARLLLLDSFMLRELIERVRSHGRLWSIRDEVTALNKVVKSVEILASSGTDIQIRAVALLIVGLGNKRYHALTSIVEEWLRSSTFEGLSPINGCLSQEA